MKCFLLNDVFENWSTFCELTGLHGLAYTVSGRNRAETVFWILAVIFTITWAGVNCVISFISLGESPVIVTVQTFKHEASKVPFPVITFCPEQQLDDLNLPAILMNRIKFRCRANTAYATDLDMCDAPALAAVRNPNSVFSSFLSELEALVDMNMHKIGELLKLVLKKKV